MAQQSSLYKPTDFWSDASNSILKELADQGVDSFRSLESSLWFFVPTYGHPGSGITQELITSVMAELDQLSATEKQKKVFELFLNGYQSALADYRVFLASNSDENPPLLNQFSESKVGCPKEHFEFDDKWFSRSSLNYLLGLSFLKKHINFNEIQTVLEIGGGFGTLGEILLKTTSDLKYIDIDIPPTANVSHYYLNQNFGQENVTSFLDVEKTDEILIKDLKKASVLCSWQIEKLVGKVDLFVNYISFQEMEPDVVDNYLKHVSRLGTKWVLLRNMREGKQLKKDNGVGVKQPILSSDYENMLENFELVERNVNPFGFKTVDGYHSEIFLFRRKD